jgi:hypothetical protein
MTISSFLLPNSAPAALQFTASGETDVRIGNPSQATAEIVSWTCTTSDTPPSVSPQFWNKIPPLGGEAIQMQSGERLWLAGSRPSAVYATLEV